MTLEELQAENQRLKELFCDLTRKKITELQDTITKYNGARIEYGHFDITQLPFHEVRDTINHIIQDEKYIPYFSRTDSTMIISRTYENNLTDEVMEKFLFAYSRKYYGLTEFILRNIAVRFAELAKKEALK